MFGKSQTLKSTKNSISYKKAREKKVKAFVKKVKMKQQTHRAMIWKKEMKVSGMAKSNSR